MSVYVESRNRNLRNKQFEPGFLLPGKNMQKEQLLGRNAWVWFCGKGYKNQAIGFSYSFTKFAILIFKVKRLHPGE